MPRRLPLLLVLGAALVLAGRSANAQTQIQIYGSWHCGNDFCTWGSVRDMTDFDTKNHWMIDRGDGSGLPSVNLVIPGFGLCQCDGTEQAAQHFGGGGELAGAC